MAITGRFEVKAILVLGLTLFSCVANGAASQRRSLIDRRSLTDTNAAAPSSSPSGGTVFDVTQFGAKADDKTDNALSFIKAWRAGCDSGSPAKVVIPQGTFVASPTVFQGPCKAPMTMEVQGVVKATTDISQYTSPEWISFEIIDGLTLNGKGTFDGQGAAVWKYNDCDTNKNCANLPDSLKFHRVNNADISDFTSLNSKYFHLHVVKCGNIRFHHMNITAPDESPNTDGIHISNSNAITVASSFIGTGDDCVSVGQGVTNLTVKEIICGPGHGISVGSLGKYPNEEDVSGIVVSNCTLSNTTNGVRIKTYPASMASLASSIVFQDIIMDQVKNPIIIDQNYGSKSTEPSRVKISDVHFRNIKGTSTSIVAVNLECSSAVPCEGVELQDIDLAYTGSKGSAALTATCTNAKVTAGGTQNPGACP
ncbi:hypothetical protein P3X46_015102 [Hevea brasiliensis]|uniref:Exopolygalacturonase-like n=1 Tax=Hevea brasiliensis TaxID=3981 RepID=A0ABQ9LUY8_HEVBR|nr:exopolygalacturonase-like [Hevea brasiliensis]KAJ9171787.1 hypothetical protein P3X46_015102 [Hevea brasiliensis]